MFRDNLEAFQYLHGLMTHCRQRNLNQAADYLDELLSGRGAETSTENLGMVAQGLRIFVERYGRHFNEEDLAKIEDARQTYAVMYRNPNWRWPMPKT